MIRTGDDKILSQESKEASEEDVRLVKKIMRKTCRKLKGIGIAAPQVGYLVRVIFIDYKGLGYFMVNPKITHRSEETNTGSEGCLSYPGVYCDVERHSEITVKYTTEDNLQREESFSGLHARVIQHEIDHLNGKCWVGEEWRRRQENK